MSFRKIPLGKCAQFDAYIKRICLNEAAKATRTIRRRFAREGADANIMEIADSRLDHDADEPLPDTIRIGGYVFEIRKSCLYDALILLNESGWMIYMRVQIASPTTRLATCNAMRSSTYTIRKKQQL